MSDELTPMEPPPHQGGRKRDSGELGRLLARLGEVRASPGQSFRIGRWEGGRTEYRRARACHVELKRRAPGFAFTTRSSNAGGWSELYARYVGEVG